MTNIQPWLARGGAVLAALFASPRWILGVALVAAVAMAVVALVASAVRLEFAWVLTFIAAVNIAFIIRAVIDCRGHRDG